MSSESGELMQRFLATAKTAALEAGEIIRAAHRRPRKVDTKSSSVDLVTETDRACEEAIMRIVRSTFPDHAFIAEETAASEPLTDTPTWIIDPLDGTTNFVHGIPHVVTSIAVSVKRDLVVGVIYHPFLNEMFSAVRGGGAFLNDRPIRVSSATALPGALVSTNFGHDRSASRVGAQLAAMQRLLQAPCHGLRTMGAAAAAMCDVAAGRADAFYEVGIKPWDVAAGAVIVREAGGHVCDVGGGAFDVMCGRVLAAATPALAAAVADALQSSPPSAA